MKRSLRVVLVAAATLLGCGDADPLELDLEVVRVDVAPADRVLAVGDTMRLTAHPRTEDGQVPGGLEITWQSEDDAIVGVQSHGYWGTVEAKQVGSTRIRAIVDGVVGEVTVTVMAAHQPVAVVEITPAHPVLGPAETVQLEAVLRAADGTVLGGRPVSWTTSNAAVATIASMGSPARAVVHGHIAGEAIITATSEGIAGTTRIRVSAPEPAIAYVLVKPSTLGAWVDQSLTYEGTARVFAANGLPIEGRTVTWSVSDTTVARMQPGGALTALRAGSTQVIAKAGNVTGQATLIVFERPAGSTMQFHLTYNWWDDDVRIAPTVATTTYTDRNGVVRTVDLFPESGTFTIDKQFQGDRYVQEIVLAGYADDGSGQVKRVAEQRITDRGTYTFDPLSAAPLVFRSQLKPGFTFTGQFREYEFHLRQAMGTETVQEYRYRVRQ